jgi:hypothetical protein
MKKMILALALLPILSNASEILTSEMYCDDTKIIVKELTNKYHEEPFLVGQANDVAGSVMTFWMNPLTKSWTIVATKGDLSCLVGVGEELKVIPARKKINI